MEPIKFNIPIDQLDGILCEVCGKDSFVTAFVIKMIPALYSPNGQKGLGQIHTGYCCTYCGASYDLAMNRVYDNITDEE